MSERLYNIRLTVAYDGSRYHGWQRQKNSTTVQGNIEDRIRLMIGEHPRLIASGRTDAGVHAHRQVCNFVTRSKIRPPAIRKGLNSLLEDDIFIIEAAYVPMKFHARYSAVSKTYEYLILNREDPDIFRRNYLWHVRPPLDSKLMAGALSLLEGTHDFSSFRSSGSDNHNPVRTVTRAELHNPADGLLRIIIEADGFLRHMVRNIVGTLAGVGRGKITPRRFEEIFGSKDRRLAGVKAPPQGLFLVEVRY